MNRLWLLLLVCLPMAWLIDQRDLRNKSIGLYRRERVVTSLLIIVLIFFCGLRIWGNDTVTYLQMYEQVEPFDKLMEDFDIPYAHGPAFYFCLSLIKSWGFTEQDYLMFYACLTIPSYVLFMRRYSKNTMFGVFLMLATGFYTFAMAAIKQTTSTAFCLWAIPMALDKKWIHFSLLVFLGSLFHPYALVYFIVPLMMFEPWKSKTIFWISIFTIAGFALETMMGTIVDVTAMMGAEYSAEEMQGEGVNIFRVLVCFVPLFLAIFFGSNLFEGTSRKEHLLFNLAMVNALIMFVGLFGTANYFARLANYFLPAQVVTLPWMISSAHAKDRRWLLPCCIIGYAAYFYYENAILRPFDSNYTQMALGTYLEDVFVRVFR